MEIKKTVVIIHQDAPEKDFFKFNTKSSNTHFKNMPEIQTIILANVVVLI